MSNRWLRHVNEYRLLHPTLSYKVVLQQASRSYWDVYSQQGGSPYKHTALILGAHYKESHVQRFLRENPSYKVITMSLDINLPDTERCVHLQMNFNDLEKWQEFQKHTIDLDLVIVDWSTAKFFGSEYNIIIGKIMQIILDILTLNGKFYTSCCSTGSAFVGQTDSFIDEARIQRFTYTTHIPLSYLMPIEGDDDLTMYKRRILEYFPKSFSISLKKILNPAVDDYPLHNPQQEYPFEYIKALKITL